LQPTKRHMKVARYVDPKEFEELQVAAEALGFHCASGPLVRSSYKAGALFKSRLERRAAAAESNGAADNVSQLRPRELGAIELGLVGAELNTSQEMRAAARARSYSHQDRGNRVAAGRMRAAEAETEVHQPV